VAGSNPAMIVRVAANLEELKKNLLEGKSQIETTTAAMQKMAASFSGEKIIQAAHNVTAAVESIGGVTKLTGAEQERVNSILDRARDKYLALGKEVPAGMQALYEATRKLPEPTDRARASADSLHQSFSKFDSILASLGVNVGTQTKAISEIASASGQTAAQLGVLSTAGLAVGTGLAAWGIGRAIADFFGLDAAIGNATAKLFGFGDAVGEAAAAKADVLAKASAEAGRAITDFGEAMQINADAAERHARGIDTAANRIQWFHDQIGGLRASGDFESFTKDLDSQVYTHEELAKKYGITVQAIENYIREQKAAADADQQAADAMHARNERLLKDFETERAAAKPFKDAMREIDEVGQGWQHTLDTIDGTIVEAIKFYLQAGVSQKALADAYGLTDNQVKAIATSLRDESTKQQEAAASADQHAKAARDAADALDREAEQLKKVKQHAEEVAAAERKAAEEKKALNRAMGNTLDIAHAVQADPELADLLHMGWSFENAEQILLSRKYGFTPKLFSPKGTPETTPDPSERVPGYAAGILNAPGGWAMVGERGPEPMYVPPGANIYPSGTPVGGATVLNIYVTQPLGTPGQIAAAVDAAIVKRMRDRGFRY
jgi:hypothetical protein